MDGNIKGIYFIDVRNQSRYINKQDAASTTDAIDSLLFTCTIDTRKRLNFDVEDIPVSYLIIEIDD